MIARRLRVVSALASVALLAAVLSPVDAFAASEDDSSPDQSSELDLSTLPSTRVPDPDFGGLVAQSDKNGLDTDGPAVLTGTVYDAYQRPQAVTLSGVDIHLILLDDSGHAKKTYSTSTDANGHYELDGLPNANYALFFRYIWPDTGEAISLYSGASFDLVDPTTNIDFDMIKTGTVSGAVTCGACSTPPTSSDLRVILAYDSGGGHFLGYKEVELQSDGSFEFHYVEKTDNLAVFVVSKDSGAGYAKQSNSAIFSTAPGQTVTGISVIAAHSVHPVSGIVPLANEVVNSLYWDFLSRFPASAEVQGWGKQLQSGANPGVVSAGFVNSDEYRLIRITGAYRTILGREGEQAGVFSWLHAMQAGAITTDDIERSLYASQEFYQAHGNTDTSYAQALYTTLLHRDGTSSDYAFWSNLVAKNGRTWVISQFWDSTETISERVSLMYAFYLGRRPDSAGLKGWVNVALQIGDSGLRAGFSGSAEYLYRSQFRFHEES